MNAYFRVLVSEEGFAKHEELVLRDLHGEPWAGLRHKLNNWPPKILGKSIRWQKHGPARIKEIRELRNRLMHFTSSQETAEAEGVRFHGMADVSDFETLTPQVAFDAVTSAEDVVAEVFRMRGGGSSPRAGAPSYHSESHDAIPMCIYHAGSVV